MQLQMLSCFLIGRELYGYRSMWTMELLAPLHRTYKDGDWYIYP